MKFEIVKADSGKFCTHHACKKDDRYVTPKGRIRKGTICVRITHDISDRGRWKQEEIFFYCRTCIDQILLDCKLRLNATLWPFE